MSTLPKPIDQHRVVASGRVNAFSGITHPLHDPEGFLSFLALPLHSDPVGDAPSRAARDAVDWSNASVLGLLLRWVDLEAMPRPADTRLAEALTPLRIRLDMLIDLLTRLSYRDIALPVLCEIELAATRIAWGSRQAWQRGEWLRLALYFHPIFREPVTLFAKVTCCAVHARGDGWRVTADLLEMPENITERLARLALFTQRQQRAWQPGRAAEKRQA